MWFKYLKSSEIVSPSSENENYSYPISKRYITKFTPKDTLSAGVWIFVDVSNYSINQYFDSDIQSQTDDNSYIVVYEKQQNFYPVKSIIHDGILYFQIYENHAADYEIEGSYCIYYNTSNIRNINTVNNGGITSYQINTVTKPYAVTFSEVDTSSYDVDLQSTSTYNFSFLNSNQAWDNGLATSIGATCYINFSGPSIIIYGSKGPDCGIVKLKLIGLPNKDYKSSKTEIDSLYIDCFSTLNQENVIIYENNSLDYRDYNLKIEVISNKNLLSTNNKIQLNSFSFSYNTYIYVEKELFTDNNIFVKIGAVK